MAHLAMIGVKAVSHVLPSLAVIAELVARGHRVTYANDPEFAERIVETGAEFVPFESRLPFGDWPQDPIAAAEVFLDDAMRVLPQVRAFYDHDPADLYLGDIGSYAGRVVAESQGRPFTQFSPTFVAWHGYEQEVGAALKALPGAEAYQEKFAAWLAECGATTTDPDDFSGRPTRSIALIPRAMQPNADRVDEERVTFVGPCFGTRADAEWRRPDNTRRIALVSLGSQFTRQPGFYRRCAEAFGALSDWHLVLQIGRLTDPGELGDLPPNVEIHSWVPQLSILRQAELFITHAGMGGCGEGLLTGTPMIAVPQGVDQFMNADRLVELGVARRLDTDAATVDALRTAITTLPCDPTVARRCAELRAAAEAEGGTHRAATLVEAELP